MLKLASAFKSGSKLPHSKPKRQQAAAVHIQAAAVKGYGMLKLASAFKSGSKLPHSKQKQTKAVASYRTPEVQTPQYKK
jgi:hypothetical protein